MGDCNCTCHQEEYTPQPRPSGLLDKYKAKEVYLSLYGKENKKAGERVTIAIIEMNHLCRNGVWLDDNRDAKYSWRPLFMEKVTKLHSAWRERYG